MADKDQLSKDIYGVADSDPPDEGKLVTLLAAAGPEEVNWHNPDRVSLPRNISIVQQNPPTVETLLKYIYIVYYK